MSSKGPFQLGKTSNIKIFSIGRFFTQKSLFSRILEIHFMRHGNEKYTSKELDYAIFEDKQVTTAAHFRFNAKF